MALALLFLARPASAADEIKLDRVAVGFNGKYKVGAWTPVSVTLSGPAVRGRLELHTADADDVDSMVSYEDMAVDAQQPRQLLVRFGSAAPTLTVVFQPAEGQPLRWELPSAPPELLDERHIPQPLPSTHELLVEIGRGLGLHGPGDTKKSPSTESSTVARLDEASQLQQLPTEWIGYEGVDALLLGTSQELAKNGGLLATVGGRNIRWLALAQWVRNGGRLVIVGGGRAEQLASALHNTFDRHRESPDGKSAGEKSLLEELMPGRLVEDVGLDRAEKLDEYVAVAGQGGGAFEPFPLPLSDPADPTSLRRLIVPRLAEIVGAVELAQDTVPLVVRVPRGFGEVIFVALDLDLAPLARWSGRGALVNKLLRKPPEAAKPRTDESDSNGPLLYAGVNDLAGQLKGTLDQFTDISPVSFVLVASLALLYIGLIGPLDYVLVRKVLRRPELTWVTFPLLVILFSVATHQIASWMKGKQLLLNQIDVVDVDLSSRDGLVRGQTWFNVFSPDGRAYDVSLRPRLPGSGANRSGDGSQAPPAADGMRTVVAWLGLPGEALGGMERVGTPGLFQGSYHFTPQSDAQRKAPLAMEGVPFQVWSSRSFTARWTRPADSPPPAVECDLRRDGDRLRGTIRNRMDVALVNCLLVFRTRTSGSVHSAQMIPIAELKAGQTFSISPAASPDDLAAHIKGSRYVQDSKTSETLSYRSKEYDPLGTDVPSILKQMSFYRLIKGREHTRLLHRYQGHLDLSHLLEPKLPQPRAILIGFASQPAAEVRWGERVEEERPHDQHWTCYRFVASIAE